MAKFSRDKGSRNERLLVAHLKEMGYSALRVPLSGMMEGYKSDVIATKDQITYTFELKVRATEYSSIYHFYSQNKDGSGTLKFSSKEALMTMSSDFEQVKDNTGSYPVLEDRTAKKLAGMRKLLGEAQYLVLRGDRQGFLFVKYL